MAAPVSHARAMLDRQRFDHALRRALEQVLGPVDPGGPLLERPADPTHGEYASSLALRHARTAAVPPRVLAARLLEALEISPADASVTVAGPGFLNFRLSPTLLAERLRALLADPECCAVPPVPSPGRYLVEFVSANPNGPLHVGHGRGAAYGDSLAAVLAAVGHRVEREYYLNDAGRQMDILTLSVWLRYLEALGAEITLPQAAYRGEYVVELARALLARHGRRFVRPLPAIGNDESDPDREVDAWVAAVRAGLGEKDYRALFDEALDAMRRDIAEDLDAFGVRFDRWTSERALREAGVIDDLLARLRARGAVYEKDGALWLRASDHGDEKDRVLVRSSGTFTYFTPDLAYHVEKADRGYDRCIDVFGADHHGYAPRLHAGLRALGIEPPERLEVVLVQFVTLWRGNERAKMSTRAGEFVTLRQLREEVGHDAARFFYVMRSHHQPLDFDLDLAVRQSPDNPVYYVQYAHTRVRGLLRKAGVGATVPEGLERLAGEADRPLLVRLSAYAETLHEAADLRAPHVLVQYLRDLAGEFHNWYAHNPVLDAGEELRAPRLALAAGVGVVLRHGLGLIGVSAPERM
jgi:arginyl-tRNA synthetase